MNKMYGLIICCALMPLSCGTTSSDNDAGLDAGQGQIECTVSQIKLQGLLQNEEVDLKYAFGDQILTTEPTVWILYPDDGGRIRFELQNMPEQGQATAANVTMTLGSIGGADLGNCRSDGYSSSLTLWENKAVFVLENLYTSPFCGGEHLDGTINGCASW